MAVRGQKFAEKPDDKLQIPVYQLGGQSFGALAGPQFLKPEDYQGQDSLDGMAGNQKWFTAGILPTTQEEKKTSREVPNWEELCELLQEGPHYNMGAKEAKLLEKVETLEHYCEEGTLQHWVLDRICQALSSGKDDTVGCVAACMDVIAMTRKPLGGGNSHLHPCQCHNVQK